MSTMRNQPKWWMQTNTLRSWSREPTTFQPDARRAFAIFIIISFDFFCFPQTKICSVLFSIHIFGILYAIYNINSIPKECMNSVLAPEIYVTASHLLHAHFFFSNISNYSSPIRFFISFARRRQTKTLAKCVNFLTTLVFHAKSIWLWIAVQQYHMKKNRSM